MELNSDCRVKLRDYRWRVLQILAIPNVSKVAATRRKPHLPIRKFTLILLNYRNVYFTTVTEVK